MTMLRAALIQSTAAREFEPNFEQIGSLVRQAASDGAEFILTPENVTMLEPKRDLALAKARMEADHPGIPFFADLAKQTGTHLLAGSLSIKTESGKLHNRSYLFGPDGAVIAKYSKIHLFDVDLPSGETYRESSTFAPGDQAVIAGTPFGLVGLTICYDVRFPQLYRVLAQAGASILTVPAAFTRVTGMAHWQILLQARAIETGCFVLAPAQTGEHAEGRTTYGHSLIITPWGEVLADAGTEVGYVIADLDLDKVAESRGRVPSLRHDRAFAAPQPLDKAAE
jgi:predicted amidohydrolase